MATGMQINNIAILDPMDAKGEYFFDTPVVGSNGRGLSTPAPYSVLTWHFDSLTAAEYAWWFTTLLSGAPSAEFSQCKMFNQVGALMTYTHCVVRRPTYGEFRDGLMYDVTVVIDRIY